MSQDRKPLLRRLFPSPPLSATVFVFWLLLSDSLGLGAAVVGMLLGVAVPLAAARLDREFARIGSLRSVPKMLCVVAWDIVRSNVKVATQVLGPESRIRPGFIWIPLDIGNIHGITALTSMITLTPGTVSVALSDDRKYLLVHVLHLDDPDTLIAEIKHRYEKPLMEIFP
ncbi:MULTISPECIES: Na+/H+ antiporter subunit E [Gammaproteobacteria]|jgi:multicomponent K+:H+ antiporter subunit E|uniref:Na+/H+ antiporter subunit E n=1 Tax=Xanthomonas boreopolis TaxID=86183 RepID=A0A919F8P5_9XANT|nr:Na+/H+ antiporter subunit E [Pseudomonas sp. Hp2]GHH54882.1 Na+/H+ antiporter subunit E [[Pseudomonas] boreopolis]